MPGRLYPLRFEPIFKTVIWGGHALRPFLGAPPSAEATGEAWILSDQGEHSSCVANGPLAGINLRQLMREQSRELIGDVPTCDGRFPLLLKFLDARENLSVQVHPNDEQALQLENSGLGKTEAWVILKSEPGSQVYAGLKKGVTRESFHQALKKGALPSLMHKYEPKSGDCIFLEAGTVHAIGAGLMLFEVQQTSDATYRLYDWGRVDAKTGKPRKLHIEQAVACTNYDRGPCDPVNRSRPDKVIREPLVQCRYFKLERLCVAQPFEVGAAGECRIVTCVSGSGILSYDGGFERLEAGMVFLLPAITGTCRVEPSEPMTVLECGLGSQASETGVYGS